MHPSSPIRDAAGEPGRRATASQADRDGFRPLALPALAAAVRVGAQAPAGTAKSERQGAAARRFLHEDAVTEDDTSA